jgi:hypothetical protein
MNSVLKYITPATLAATLVAMRSGRKEVFLVVEGKEDVALYSQVFGLSRSYFVQCNGKNNLMALFAIVPARGLDSGTIFLRDRDNDGIRHTTSHDVSLLVSDLYDVEMHLLNGRIFGRLMSEFLQNAPTPDVIDAAFCRVIGAAAWVGALKLYSHVEGLALDFDNLKFSFVDQKTLEVDVRELVRRVFARSEKRVDDLGKVVKDVERIYRETGSLCDITSGKDVIEVLSLALSRHYKCCSASECSIGTLGRMIRISATLTDLQEMSLYGELIKKIALSPFRWAGVAL